MKIISISDSYKKVLYFFIRIAALYTVWLLLEASIFKPSGLIDNTLVLHLINFTYTILNLLGFDTFVSGNQIGIDGTHGVTIGSNCNGLSLMALFIGFMIAYPLSIKNKIIGIFSGVFIIHFLNLIRLVMLAIIVNYYPSWLEFHHKYTFTLIVYTFIVLMWIYWLNKESKK